MKDTQPYIDERGRTWLPFAFKFRNETDGMTFGFEIYAIDRAHAEDQLIGPGMSELEKCGCPRKESKSE